MPDPRARRHARLRLLAALQAFLLVVSAIGPIATLAADPPTDPCAVAGAIQTDAASYLPGDTATISGSGFGAGCELQLATTLPDNSTSAAPVAVDDAGSLTYALFVAWPTPAGTATIDVLDPTGSVLATAAFTVEASPAPWVNTEVPDYSPGSTVEIRGGNWWPGETVTLRIQEDPATHPDTTYTATANAYGEFLNAQFLVLDDHLGTTFTLTATGSSGRSASWIFTDGASDQYRTRQSGNWNDINTWQVCTAGCSNEINWLTPPASPDSSIGAINVRSGHTVTVTAATTIDQATIESGGQVTVNSGVTLSVADGTNVASSDLTVAGILSISGTVSLVTGGAGSVPVLNVASGGALTITGSASVTGNGTATLSVASGGSATINGPVSGLKAFNVDGTATSSADITIVPLSTAEDLQVGGNLTLTAGTLTLARASSCGGSAAVGAITSPGTLTLSGSSTLTIGVGSTCFLNVNSGTLDMGPDAIINGNGFVSAPNTATVRIGSTGGISSGTSTGNVRTIGVDTWNSPASYSFKGVADQVTGDAFPTALTNDLTINNSGGSVTLTNSLNLNGTLVLTSGDLLTGANTLTQPTAGSTTTGVGEVVGSTKRDFQFNIGTTYTMGGPFTTLNLSAAGTKPQTTTFTLVKSAPGGLPAAVARTYTVTTTTGGTVSATGTVRFHYLDSELNGNAEATLKVWRLVSGVWTEITGGTTTQDTTSNWVQVTGVAFSGGGTTSSDFALRGTSSDTTAPTSVISFPVNGTSYNATGFTDSITGTASDNVGGSGLASVQVQVVDSTNSTHWSGVTFVAGTSGFVAASGLASWSLALADSNLTTGHSYTVTSKATDVATNVESSPPSVSFTYDSTAPAAPTFTSTNPASPSTTSTAPAVIGTASSADTTAVTLYSDNTCATQIGTGTKAVFEGAGITATVGANTTTAIYGKTFDAAGNSSACTFLTNYQHINTYTVTSSSSGNGTISPSGGQTVNHGDQPSFNLTPSAGYHISSVSGTCGGNLVASTFTTAVVTASCTVVANFAINTYTVTPSAGAHGSLSPSTPQTVNHGSTTAFTVTPDTGYHVSSVSGCSGSLVASTFTTGAITADCTVTASFAINTYTLDYAAGANGSLTGDTSQVVDYGTDGTAVTAVGNTGYHFTAWSDLSTDNPRTDTAVTANVDVTASFAINTYTVTSSSSGNGTISPSGGQTVNHGDQPSFNLTPSAGYHISSVSGTCGGNLVASTFTTAVVTASCTVVANFAINTYTVTPSAGAHGSLSPSTPQTVNHGSTTAFTVTPDTGYHVSSVSGCSGSLVASTFTTGAITADCTVTASFAINTYTVTPSSSGNGSIDPATAQGADYGSQPAFTLTPDTGYHIDSVTGTCDGDLAGDTFTTDPVTADCTVVANFAINTYTLDYAAGANGSLTGDTSQVVDYGTDGTAVTAVPNTGYHFTAWSDLSTDNPRTDTAVTANVDVTANFAIDTFTLDYAAGANGSLAGDTSQVVDYGTDGTAVTAVPNTGYHFTAWSDLSTDNPRTDTAVTANVDVTASFAINTYTVTPSAGAHGSLSPSTPQTVNHGSTTAFTVTPDTGYHVSSVSGCSGSLVASTFTTGAITADCTVTASFAINTYTLDYAAGANGSLTGDTSQVVDYGTDGTAVTAVPNTGYHFTAWSDLSTDNPRTDTAVTANVDVTASFAINTYTVTSSSSGNGTISPSGGQTVNHGDQPSFNLTPSAGYHISSVSGTCGGNLVASTFTTAVVTASCTVVANFAINTYTVTPSAGAHGSLSPSTPQTVNHGSTTAFTVTPDTGYHVSSVSGCSGSLVASTFTTGAITADCTVTASFAINTYTVTPSSSGNGSIDPATAQGADYGSQPAFTLTPDTGYHIDSVTGTCDGDLAGDTFTTDPVTADCTVVANFAINTYTLDYAAGANGSLTGDTSQVVDYGTDGTAVTAVPNTGYHFTAWSDLSTDNPRTDTAVTANVDVTASFAINTYTVTSSSSGNGTISPSGGQTVNHGDQPSFNLTPSAGYHISSVSGTCGGNLVASTFTTAVVTASCTVVANFAINTYTVTPSAGAHGSLSPSTPQTVNHGSTTAFTVTPDTGYHVSSVSGCSGSLVASTFTTGAITADCTVTASFAINTYTLDYAAGANGSLTGDTSQVVDYGTDGTAVTAVGNTGYHFTAWSDLSTDNPRTDTAVTANVDVTASFAIDTFTLDYAAGANGSLAGDTSQVVDYGTDGTAVTAVPNTGYHFTAWSDLSTDNPRIDTAVTANVDVTASFAINTYTVSPGVAGGAHGSVSPSVGQTVAYGSTTAFTVTPDTGYHIATVTGCGGSLVVSTYTTGSITADCSVTATFAINTYAVTPSSGAHGSLSPSTPQTVNHGSTTAFTVSADAGYHVASVSGCGGSLVVSTFTTGAITADCTVTASFAVNTYTVTPSAGAHGSLSPSIPQTVSHGATTAFTVTPDAGYHIDTVSGCGGSLVVNTFTTGLITAACTVTASFAVDAAAGTYTYTGFFAPVDNPSILNVAKAGQAIPVKWRIYDLSGAVADPSSFVSLTSAEMGCGLLVAGTVDTVETYSGSSGLQYLGVGNWQFNWKTPTSYANTCRSMKLTLKDGSTHFAYFNFKK